VKGFKSVGNDYVNLQLLLEAEQLASVEGTAGVLHG